MTFIPDGMLSTSYKLTLMLSKCETVRKILEVETEDEALDRMTTYSEEEFECPRVQILENEFNAETGPGGEIIGIASRMLGCEFFLYSPLPDDIRTYSNWDGSPDPVTKQDEHSYVLTQFGAIIAEMLAQTTTGGKLALHDPTIFRPELYPFSERFDSDELSKGDEARSLWFGIIAFEVR